MERTIAEELNETQPQPMETIEPIEQTPTKGIDLGFLKAPTGEGSVGDYLDHPMNFNNSKGMARVLRGLTGMMGSLDLAIIDIVVGTLDLLKTNKRETVQHDNTGVYIPR